MLNCNLISLQNGANPFIALVSSSLPEALSLVLEYSSPAQLFSLTFSGVWLKVDSLVLSPK